MQTSVRATGIVCTVITALCLVPAVQFHSLWPALRIGLPSLLAGCLLGLCMASITRTRRPTLIYLLIAAGVVTAWPIYHPWPAITLQDVIEYDGPMSRVITYLEALRPMLYLSGMPFLYAWCGQHSSDPTPAAFGSGNAEQLSDSLDAEE